MRFDDRLTTVLKGALPTGLGAAMQWRQVIDLLAQKPKKLANEDLQSGLTRLRDLHDHVSDVDRQIGVLALHGRLRSAPLLVYLCADQSQVSELAIAAADLPDEQWADIIPQLSKDVQEYAARREDLGPMSRHALGLAPLPYLSVPKTDDIDQPSQISSLVEKIEDYQRKRLASNTLAAANDRAVSGQDTVVQFDRSYFVETVDSISFETDDCGTITWVEGPPNGSVVGVTISEPAFDNGPGPDAYGAAAFRQRMPLENARMRLCGAPVVAGDWRMTGIPYFDPQSGRFKGYRGMMRRPNAAEDVGEQNAHDIERREQLQQLIHELRTPLNAIIGFSEIIEQQLFGPVSFEYRALSSSIMAEARRVLTGFEDLDLAAKVDAGQMEGVPGTTEAEWLLERLVKRLKSLTQGQSVELKVSSVGQVQPFALDSDTVERIYARLLSACVIACNPNEELRAELHAQTVGESHNCFSISRPKRIQGISEADLLDPSQGIDGDSDDAPLLGLGFSLRLVRNLARGSSGSLVITDEKIELILPATAVSPAKALETEIE